MNISKKYMGVPAWAWAAGVYYFFIRPKDLNTSQQQHLDNLAAQQAKLGPMPGQTKVKGRY